MRPAPGGGSSTAVTVALAAALVEMAGAIAGAAPAIAGRAAGLRARALGLAQAELTSYEPVLEALRLPEDDPERAGRVEAALEQAGRTPAEIAETAAETAELGAAVLESAQLPPCAATRSSGACWRRRPRRPRRRWWRSISRAGPGIRCSAALGRHGDGPARPGLTAEPAACG